ncbi:MAG: carboxymuconolactone decarboxylase family protein [Candidatus Wallbacteria bacterium]|nr:carboxymuconolactone decarboxylase family protein [Candidatus Wallbacteria bacterium]
MTKHERLRRGEEIGRKIVGNKWDRLVEVLQQTHPDMAKYIVEWAYGEVFARPDLGLREREIASVVCLTILRLGPQLKTHIYGALNVGLSERELMELFIHMAMFVGFPTALFGTRIAKDVFEELARKKKKPKPEASGEIKLP